MHAPSGHLIPPPEQAIALPVPELAVRLLSHLVAAEDANPHTPGLLHPYGVSLNGHWPHHAVGQHAEAFLRAIAEAWAWLEANALVARKPGHTEPWSFVTRAGRMLVAERDGLARLRAEQRLGLDLHPRIAGTVQAQFLLGDYEIAVFAAMKEVEIRVRELGGLPDDLVGVKLMQQAFRPGGPLHDPELEAGEQDGRLALFRGAIGVFKNPSSHREVDYADPTAASEIVLLADLLLRMLDDIEARLQTATD
jgi:uncharacterized protein (TIGR02391 family)